jgi:hypothetical protein
MNRRTFFTAGVGSVSALALAPSSAGASVAPVPMGGQLVTLLSPIRVFDSRTDAVPLDRKKLRSGESVAVTVSTAFADTPSGFALSVFVNCTVTQTEGSGYLVIRGSDLSGEIPLPKTSNVNWSTSNQTLANLVLSTVGGENALEVHCDGGGATHVIIDVLGYVPYLMT